MSYRPGVVVPVDGIYWCSVCKTPQKFEVKQEFPPCPNLCGKCHWELVEKAK